MKPAAVLLVLLAMTGCATKPSPKAMSYQELYNVKVSTNDCANIEPIISRMEQQLRLRGILDKQPEELDEPDRLYNARARNVIWALRIGCNNPDRYKK